MVLKWQMPETKYMLNHISMLLPSYPVFAGFGEAPVWPFWEQAIDWWKFLVWFRRTLLCSYDTGKLYLDSFATVAAHDLWGLQNLSSDSGSTVKHLSIQLYFTITNSDFSKNRRYEIRFGWLVLNICLVTMMTNSINQLTDCTIP